MRIPYSEIQLHTALIGLKKKLNEENQKKLEELTIEFKVLLPDEKKSLNQTISQFHGISVEQLINSPNYSILCQEYKEHVLKKLAQSLKEKIGVTDEQAWALIALSIGLI